MPPQPKTFECISRAWQDSSGTTRVVKFRKCSTGSPAHLDVTRCDRPGVLRWSPGIPPEHICRHQGAEGLLTLPGGDEIERRLTTGDGGHKETALPRILRCSHARLDPAVGRRNRRQRSPIACLAPAAELIQPCCTGLTGSNSGHTSDVDVGTSRSVDGSKKRSRKLVPHRIGSGRSHCPYSSIKASGLVQPCLSRTST